MHVLVPCVPALGLKIACLFVRLGRWAFATRPKNWQHWYLGNHQTKDILPPKPILLSERSFSSHINTICGYWMYPMDYPHSYYMSRPAGKRTQVSVYVSNVGVRRGRMRIAPRTPSAAGCRVHMVVSLLPQKI